MSMLFLCRHPGTKRLKGVRRGPSVPVDNAENEFVIVDEAGWNAARAAQKQAIREFRSTTVENDGSVTLGAAPVDVCSIDWDGSRILKSGDSGNLTFKRLGDGQLTVTVNGQQFQINNTTPEISITISAA